MPTEPDPEPTSGPVPPDTGVDTDCDDDGPCWCGEPNPLYDDGFLDEDCGGSGELHCWCGGDLCVCHNHGAVPCYGCDSCEGLDGDGLVDDDSGCDDYNDADCDGGDGGEHGER